MFLVSQRKCQLFRGTFQDNTLEVYCICEVRQFGSDVVVLSLGITLEDLPHAADEVRQFLSKAGQIFLQNPFFLVQL